MLGRRIVHTLQAFQRVTSNASSSVSPGQSTMRRNTEAKRIGLTAMRNSNPMTLNEQRVLIMIGTALATLLLDDDEEKAPRQRVMDSLLGALDDLRAEIDEEQNTNLN